MLCSDPGKDVSKEEGVTIISFQSHAIRGLGANRTKAWKTGKRFFLSRYFSVSSVGSIFGKEIPFTGRDQMRSSMAGNESREVNEWKHLLQNLKFIHQIKV